MASRDVVNKIINDIKNKTGIICERYHIAGPGYGIKFPNDKLMYVRKSNQSAIIHVNPQDYKYHMLILSENIYIGKFNDGKLYCIKSSSKGIPIKKDSDISERILNDAEFYCFKNKEYIMQIKIEID